MGSRRSGWSLNRSGSGSNSGSRDWGSLLLRLNGFLGFLLFDRGVLCEAPLYDAVVTTFNQMVDRWKVEGVIHSLRMLKCFYPSPLYLVGPVPA